MHAQSFDEGAFARAWYARDAQTQGFARVGQAGRNNLLRQILMFGQGTLHQRDGLAKRYTVAVKDALNIPLQGHKLLMIAPHTLQSFRVNLNGSFYAFGNFEVRIPFMLLIFKVFVFHVGSRFDLAKVVIIIDCFINLVEMIVQFGQLFARSLVILACPLLTPVRKG